MRRHARASSTGSTAATFKGTGMYSIERNLDSLAPLRLGLIALSAIALLMLFAAPGAYAAYTTGSPLSAGSAANTTSSVVVNQSSHDVYVGSVGDILGGVFKRFDSTGSEIGCTLAPSVTRPGGVAVNATNGDVYIADGANATPKLHTFGAACGAEIGSPVEIGSSFLGSVAPPAAHPRGLLFRPVRGGGW